MVFCVSFVAVEHESTIVRSDVRYNYLQWFICLHFWIHHDYEYFCNRINLSGARTGCERVTFMLIINFSNASPYR